MQGDTSPPWPCFAINSELPNNGLTGAPSQTNEMSPDGLYGNTMPRMASAAGNDAEELALVSQWSKGSQRGAKCTHTWFHHQRKPFTLRSKVHLSSQDLAFRHVRPQ